MFGHNGVTKSGWMENAWWKRGLAGLVVLTMARVWLAPAADVVHAQQAGAKQVPFDATAQRNEIVEELKKTNQILLGILDTLRNNTLRVEVQQGTGESKSAAEKRK